MPSGRKSKIPEIVDEEWIERLRGRLEGRGSRARLAKEIGVDPTTISKLLAGERTPAHLVVAISRHMGMLLPRSWMSEHQWRAMAAVAGVETIADSADDENRRRAAFALVESVTADTEQASDELAEYLLRIVKKSERN